MMKKKTATIFVTGLLVFALAAPVTVLARGWGWGGRHMMGNWGPGSGYMTPYDRGPETMTPEQRTQLDQLDRKFYDETVNLRKELWDKSYELNTVLNEENPDLDKAKVLNKEINDLRTQLNEKSLTYDLEARKIAPDLRSSGGYGRSYGYHMGGYGPGMMGPGMMGRGGMMGYGGGPGMRGYGPGNCW